LNDREKIDAFHRLSRYESKMERNFLFGGPEVEESRA